MPFDPVRLVTSRLVLRQIEPSDAAGVIRYFEENEAHLAVAEAGKDKLSIVYPASSILAEPPVAVVDRNVDRRGTRAEAEAFVKYLYSDEAQEIIGRWHYRPSNPEILKKYAQTLPPFRKPLFTVAEVAGSWKDAQSKFFGDGGVFDQIYVAK